MRIGILTGGGDVPGLNPVIRAVEKKCMHEGFELVGIMEGWKGLVYPNTMEINTDDVADIVGVGGTILGSSRTNPIKMENGIKICMDNIENLGLDALIAIGGDDTLSVAHAIADKGGHVVGIPKTIDNDINGTDNTPGFDTAINIVMGSIERVMTTAQSHRRTIVVEVMGRHAGWIATLGGIAGGADYILIPEVEWSIDDVAKHLKQRYSQGKNHSIIVIAEGAKPTDINDLILKDSKTDAFGHVMLGGISEVLAKELENRTGYETRHTVLGHIQRGGAPSALDRVLGTRLGVFAVEMVQKQQWGQMAAIQRSQIVAVPLKEAIGNPYIVDKNLYDIAKLFFE